jgi:pimeloyl-ACP methyl ester carboxylesterase
VSAVSGTRGSIPGLAKIIEVITFPIAELVAGGAKFAVAKWDRDKHPHRVRIADGATFRELTDRDWKSLTKGPVLLFVHGTFSTTKGAFGGLPAKTMANLIKRYDGRVIAFDHPTIADDPFENARQFFDIVGDRALELDVVCHSRGGLVARAIAERPKQVDRAANSVRVNRIVFVGVPNAGTILADAKHWEELVNRFTTILSLVPGPGVTDVLESVLALVKSIAVKTATKLDGLSAMAPPSQFLKDLNGLVAPADKATYVAIVSDYEPTNPGLKAWLNDEIRDKIFDEKPNDMMVRIDSMCGDALATRFPIAKASRRAFAPAKGVEHSDYFPQPDTSKALLAWLNPSP